MVIQRPRGEQGRGRGWAGQGREGGSLLSHAGAVSSAEPGEALSEGAGSLQRGRQLSRWPHIPPKPRSRPGSSSYHYDLGQLT